jgi:hypothetical protein
MGFATTSHAIVNTEDFLGATSGVQSAFEGEVKAQLGLKLIIDADLSDNTQNAYTSRLGNIQLVKLLGGLAQVNEFTSDEIALITCHELGHSIGGLPASDKSGTLYSTEGQSDYFAASKCFKKVFQNENNLEKIKSLDVPGILVQKCFTQFANDVNEASLCIRTGAASIKVAEWIADISKDVKPKIETPDASVVTQTNTSFPSVQCRLDTLVAGALLAKRPACWFKE